VVMEAPLPIFTELAGINAKGGFSAAEAYAWHRPHIARCPELYDPRVLVRLVRGREQEAADYIDLVAARADAIRRLNALTQAWDVLVMPTVPLPAPTVASLADDAAFARVNALMLRNSSIANFFDRCAISLPNHQPGAAPTGLMLVGASGADRWLLAVAEAVEGILPPAG
jgi:aspartyl-tRNA(Asn)/glutamyl-tRNA(Gln) amidotransferase subunit A